MTAAAPLRQAARAGLLILGSGECLFIIYLYCCLDVMDGGGLAVINRWQKRWNMEEEPCWNPSVNPPALFFCLFSNPAVSDRK